MVSSMILILNLGEKRDQMGSVMEGLELRSDGGVGKGTCNGEIVMVVGAGMLEVERRSLEKQ